MYIDPTLEKNINQYVTQYTKYVLRDPDFYKKDEGYKYQAVATFRRHFDLEAPDLVGMLEAALKDEKNLVQSGQYFPKKMLLQYAYEDPEYVRDRLRELLGGNKVPVKERIDRFIDKIEERFDQSKFQSYFDYRFLSFFLASLEPNRYIYVKYKDFKTFSDMVSHDLNVSGTDGERYATLLEFAQIVREVLKENDEFRKVHARIVEPFAYKDESFSWGTTDFIFNVARRLDAYEDVKKFIKKNVRIKENKAEETEDMLVYDSIIETEERRSREELLRLAREFEPTKEGYLTKEGTYKIRQDSASQKERVKLLENYECQVCGFVLEYISQSGEIRRFAHADHIVDKSDGGTEEADNLWILCPNCHSKKTLGVIAVDKERGKFYENGKEIKVRNKHLSWYKG